MRRVNRLLASVLVASSVLASAAQGDGACKPQDLNFHVLWNELVNGITLVGNYALTPDPRGTFTMTVKDINGNPIDTDVRIDFSACPDIRLCSIQADPDMQVICTANEKYVQKNTNSAGFVSFTIMGASNNTGASPGAGYNCAEVWLCNHTFFGGNIPNVAILDQNGGGVDGSDLSAILADIFDAFTYRGRSDIDCDQTISGNDLSEWLALFFAGTSVDGCSRLSGTECP
jgi:hypothetical protein